MKPLDITYLALGATWLIVGMALGLVMGGAHNFLLAPVHAHINLVGFACHAIFGISHRLWPALAKSALAVPQFWIFVISTPVMLAGLVLTLTAEFEILTILGSLGVLVGAALFCAMIWRARASA